MEDLNKRIEFRMENIDSLIGIMMQDFKREEYEECLTNVDELISIAGELMALLETKVYG
jgi:hypothetical protein